VNTEEPAEFECEVEGLEEYGVEHDTSDGLGDLPLGWIQVQIKRRLHNPAWVELQQVKAMQYTALMSQVPEKQREASDRAVRIELDAKFHAYEQSIPKYVDDVGLALTFSPSDDALEMVNAFLEAIDREPIGSVGHPEAEAPPAPRAIREGPQEVTDSPGEPSEDDGGLDPEVQALLEDIGD
jgi:hypothetical protein